MFMFFKIILIFICIKVRQIFRVLIAYEDLMQCGPVMYLSVLVFAKISPNVVFASTFAPWWDIGETRVNINWGCSFISSSTKVAISSSARTLHGHHSKSCASVWSKGKFWEDKVVLHIICMSNIIYKGLNMIGSLVSLQQL